MIFASLVVEHEPIRWQEVPGLAALWTQDTGLLAAVALLVYGVYYWAQGSALGSRVPWPPWQALLFRFALFGSVVGYGTWAVLFGPVALAWVLSLLSGEAVSASPLGVPELHRISLLLGSGCALFAVILPFLADLVQLRWRRIWALARLSFKEAIRWRILWAFWGLLLVILFASWFLPAKPEDQVRNYVRVVYWAMSPILLVTAGLVAAFSIPMDIRNQTIHTIVTKPVERFEIVLGRFLGYVGLMTGVLVPMTVIGLSYMIREIDSEAKKESMRARVPIYGKLDFRSSRDPNFRGGDVGREWDYRKYIAGGANSSQRALWVFNDLPAHLANRERGKVTCEFSFDIFRTLKGKEGEGIFCSFWFLTRNWDEQQLNQYQQERDQERKKPDATPESIDRLLAEKYGRYEVFSKEVVDYHTQFVDVPDTLFKNAITTDHRPQAGASATEEAPQLVVLVKCESGGQYLGVAKHDFYILAKEELFGLNFFKGALGLWLRLCLVIGVAVALSTYLSGIISFVTMQFLYIAGLLKEYMQELAAGKSPGGGPGESFLRLIRRESPVVQLEQNPGAHLAQITDWFYQRVLRGFLSIVPDVERLDWTDYVSEGFNIAMRDIVSIQALVVAGYLLPWALVAYYLMKSREIASSS